MLLIPLIENCFKHGASQNIGKMHIDIEIKVEGDDLFFMVSNTIPKKRNAGNSYPRGGGIGLSNVKKRLELGYEPDDYDLRIYEKDDRFNVELNLKV